MSCRRPVGSVRGSREEPWEACLEGADFESNQAAVCDFASGFVRIVLICGTRAPSLSVRNEIETSRDRTLSGMAGEGVQPIVVRGGSPASEEASSRPLGG